MRYGRRVEPQQIRRHERRSPGERLTGEPSAQQPGVGPAVVVEDQDRAVEDHSVRVESFANRRELGEGSGCIAQLLDLEP